MKRYIMRCHYRGANGKKILADFVVYDPKVTGAGIWVTHNTAWGGTIRQFHLFSEIIDFYEEGTK